MSQSLEVIKSSAFRIQALKAIAAILLFILTYLILLVLAILMTVACIYGAYWLVLTMRGGITLFIGIGLASFGIMILVFLLKFAFQTHKVDRSHLYEINKAQEPELFQLIKELTTAVGARAPRKVYLSTDVNAAVFYDSNFWSMFLPISKNLQIGLGLVNSVSKAELKAILAHEFGHFSQKSMKVGTYVYNLNHIIYNLLYDNESYEEMAYNWGNASVYFAPFVMMAVKINEGIQWILRKLYDVLNKAYLGLSREMEFNADEIAAKVCGSEPLKKSLLRMELADQSFQAVLNYYSEKLQQKLVSENLYRDQKVALNLLATENDIPIINHFPEITEAHLTRFNKTKLTIKDQWASHPSLEERIHHLDKLNIAPKDSDTATANSLFKNIEATQIEITRDLFSKTGLVGEQTPIPFEEVQTEFNQLFKKSPYSKTFNCYYDQKDPLPFDINTEAPTTETAPFDALFAQDKVDLIYTASALQSDLATLTKIAQQDLRVKTFDYDGKKYNWYESEDLLAQLETELEQIHRAIQQNDLEIYQYFKKREQNRQLAPKLENIYADFLAFNVDFKEKYAVYIKLSILLSSLKNNMTFEEAKSKVMQIQMLEAPLKKYLKDMLQAPIYHDDITPEIKGHFELYLSKDWKYLGNVSLLNEHLDVLFNAYHYYGILVSEKHNTLKNNLLDYQTSLLKG